MTQTHSKPAKVALISPCGWGNLGDAAILQAAIGDIRARLPESPIIAFTLNPKDTEVRHQIEAHPLSAQRTPPLFIQRILNRLRSISALLFRLASVLASMFVVPWRELRHIAGSFRQLQGCRYVVVCGGGQLDEFWDGPWGHPFALLKWAVLSRLRGSKFVILSSGSATLNSALGRLFVSLALRLAQYRSFREDYAVEVSRALKAPEPNRWFPDLAFSLPVDIEAPQESDGKSTIGVSPIAWCDPRSWPDKDEPKYLRYLGRMTQFVRELVEQGHPVIFFATARADHQVIGDIRDRLNRELGVNADEKTTVSPAVTVPELFASLAQVDLVIASRLHGVILSVLALRPVLAISYDPKVAFVIEALNQSDTCLPIDEINRERLGSALQRLEEEKETIRKHFRTKISTWNDLLQLQYDQVFGKQVMPAMNSVQVTELAASNVTVSV